MARPRTRRRRLSMTSLIDVIFLLLLFFMLTSTFSKFSEVPLAAAGSGAVAQASNAKPVFLQLGPDTLRLNGDEIALDALAGSSLAEAEKGTVLLVSLGADVDAQRLTDVLVKLREMPALQVSVLGG